MWPLVTADTLLKRPGVFGAIHSGPLLVLDAAAPPQRVLTELKTAALSAAEDAICIIRVGPPYFLQCLAEDTLREMWRVELPHDPAGYSNVQLHGGNVYVTGQGRALAFSLTNGKPLWATNEFTSGSFLKVVKGAVLTRNGNFELEWRDPQSGEVIALWGKRDGSFARDAILVGETVLIKTGDLDRGDGLRLLALPDAIERTPTPR